MLKNIGRDPVKKINKKKNFLDGSFIEKNSARCLVSPRESSVTNLCVVTLVARSGWFIYKWPGFLRQQH